MTVQWTSEKLNELLSRFLKSTENDQNIETHLLDWESDAGGPLKLHLASDGLNINEKLWVEKQFKALIAAEFTSVELVVNFRRSKAAKDDGPVKPEKKNAFGLKLRQKQIPGVREVIAVASGKGGVGKSTVSVNLAVSLARQGKKVGILDADIYGPSVPAMLNLKGAMAVNDSNQLVPKIAHGVKSVSFGFLSDSYNPVIWRGPMISKALRQMAFQADWGELDYLIVDLPPGTGDIQMELIETVSLKAAVIVTTPQNIALLDAHKALSMFEKLNIPVLGVVENMSYFECSNCGTKEEIFGSDMAKFSKERETRLICRLPLQSAIRRRGDTGEPACLSDNEAIRKPFETLAECVIDADFYLK